MSEPEYEFSEEQNQLFWYLGKKMQFVGVLHIVLGVFQAGFALFSSVSSLLFGAADILVGAAVFLVIGIWTFKAGSSFRDIVTTTGADVDHLMTSLGELRKLYNLMFWLFVFGLVLAIVGVIIAMTVDPIVTEAS